MAQTVTKTIKLKIVLPKNSDGKKAIFDSHCALIEAVAEYEKRFVLMRQEEYYNSNRELVKQEDVLREFCTKLPDIKTDEQKQIVKTLYEKIALDGKAQNVGAWNSSIFGTHQMEDGKKGGRKPKDPNKIDPKKDELKAFKGSCSENNILPLFVPLLTSSLSAPSIDKGSGKLKLSFWDKAAMRVATAHLISWNAVDKTTKENYAKQTDKIKEEKEKYDNFDENLRNKIEQYCKERKDENAGFETDKEFYITGAMCGSLNEIIKEWKHKNCPDEIARLRIVTGWQSNERLKRKIGDVNFFHWLLKDDNKVVWETEDFIKTVKDYHSTLSKLGRLAPSARYTFPDKISSPRWLMYEYRGGGNLKNYEVTCENNILKLNLPLLKKNADEKFDENPYSFDLAKSEQFKVIEADGKNVKFKSGDEEFIGKFGGADLLVKLDGTGKTVKFAYFKIAMEVDKKLPYDDFEKVSSKIMHYFSNAYGETKADRHLDEISLAIQARHPIRVMSVDLGQQSFGACSVFQLAPKSDENKGKFVLPVVLPKLSDVDPEWVAVHKRSFLDKLPGEDVSDKVIESRKKAMDEVKSLKREVNILRDVLKIINQSNLAKKQKLIEQSKKYYENEIYKAKLEELSKLTTADEISIKAQEFFSEYEQILADKIKAWRNETRGRNKRNYYGGKSMWMIEYLTEVRVLLLRWSTHPRRAGKVVRQNKEKFGTVCKKLLTHINNLKDDRAKTGADLLIQSARGFVYDEKTHSWVQKFEPCNVIAFEDLRRYDFNSGKTKQENSRLMKWAHRNIIDKIKGQAALYGISIYDSTDPAYTSKFYAKTNAPGIRCRPLKNEDFTDSVLSEYLKNRIEDFYNKDEIQKLKVGDVIPMEGGKLFATIDSGKLKIVHADLNASWNLQRRFWNRHSDLLNFTTKLSGNKIQIKNDDDGKRWSGKLKLNGFKNCGLIKTDSGDYKITDNKTDTVEKSNDSKYAPNLFRDASGEFFKNQADIFIDKAKFENIVSSKIVEKLKEKSVATRN